MAKRGQNEGSIFEERPGRWVALLTLGYEVRDGKRRRVRKKFVGSTHEEVRQRLTEAIAKRDRGGALTINRTLMGDYLDDWLANTVKPSVRPKTYRSYEQMVRNHLAKSMPYTEWSEKGLDNVPGLGKIRLEHLKVNVVEQWFNAKLNAGNSAALVRYLRVVLRISLNEAIRRELIDKNPAAIAKPPRGGSSAHIEPFTVPQA